MAAADEEDVSVDLDLLDDRTVVTVTGTRDAAVIVEADGEEQVYLPPEDFDSEPDVGSRAPDSPYEGSPPADSPYEGLAPSGSPYGEGGDAEGRSQSRPILGVQSTGDGFRIVHPARVDDVRLLR